MTRLVSLAYGYLGSVADAEDVVQEARLRLEQADHASIRNADAWLTTVVTRLCLDKLRSAQHRREVYPGEWLPEPVFDAPSAEQDAITQSMLSVGLLYLLENLAPVQRAIFVLREVFEKSYEEIAEIVGKSEAACRQLMARARAAVGRARTKPAAAADGAVVSRFIDAVSAGDDRAMLEILAPEVMLVADGGGKVASVLRPIHGADRVARFFLGVRRKLGSIGDLRPALVNSGPGVLTYREGALSGVTAVEIEDGRITAIYAVSNPDKIGGG